MRQGVQSDLRGSFKADIVIDIDVDVDIDVEVEVDIDIDIDRYFGC